MRRLLMAAVFGVGTLAAVGCAGNASFKQKFQDGGVIELKAGGSMDEVHKLIEKEVGKDYVIDREEFAPVGGKFDPAKPVTGQAPAGSKVVVYRKKTPAEMSGTGGLPAVGGTGMPGAPGGVGQAGFQQRQPAGGGTGFPNSGGGLGGGMPVSGGGSGFGAGADGGVGQPPSVFPPSR